MLELNKFYRMLMHNARESMQTCRPHDKGGALFSYNYTFSFFDMRHVIYTTRLWNVEDYMEPILFGLEIWSMIDFSIYNYIKELQPKIVSCIGYDYHYINAGPDQLAHRAGIFLSTFCLPARDLKGIQNRYPLCWLTQVKIIRPY